MLMREKKNVLNVIGFFPPVIHHYCLKKKKKYNRKQFKLIQHKPTYITIYLHILKIALQIISLEVYKTKTGTMKKKMNKFH